MSLYPDEKDKIYEESVETKRDTKTRKRVREREFLKGTNE